MKICNRILLISIPEDKKYDMQRKDTRKDKVIATFLIWIVHGFCNGYQSLFNEKWNSYHNRIRIQAGNGIAAIYSACNIGGQSYEHHLVKSYEIRLVWKLFKIASVTIELSAWKMFSVYFVSLLKKTSKFSPNCNVVAVLRVVITRYVKDASSITTYRNGAPESNFADTLPRIEKYTISKLLVLWCTKR